jgi:rod shape-determining protein MreD
VILTPGAFIRVGALIVVFVVLQISGVGAIRLPGGSVDLIPLVVAAIAIFSGSVSGALAGFCTGLFLDLAVGQPVGGAALTLTLVGYFVGRYREVRDPAHGLMPIAVGAAATAAYVAGFALVSFMLEIGASVSPVVFREMLATTLLNALISLPFFAIVRRVLRPVLIVDPLERRRRRRREQPRRAGPLGLRGLEVGPR